MKRLIACASLVAVASTAALATTTPQSSTSHKAAAHKTAAHKTVAKAAPKCKVAPADEYFGKLKMSILGIRNTIKDKGLLVDVDSTKAESTFGAIALTEDAMHDWERKYPCDSWLPGTILALEHFYAKIHTAEGVKHVHATFAWLRHDYPRYNNLALASKEDREATSAPPPGTADPDAGTPAPAASAAPAVVPAAAK